MDYSQLSDQEINMLVAKIQHADKTFIESKTRPPSVVLLNHINMWIDYCNNPADAWPIIDSERISLLADYEKWGETTAHISQFMQVVGGRFHFDMKPVVAYMPLPKPYVEAGHEETNV